MNRNTVISDQEEQSYREQLSKIRFKQSLVQGFTGPTIFGLMAAGGSALLGAAGAGFGLATLAVGGLAVAAVIGLYVVSRLGAEVTSIEHAYQAKQIAKGINGKTLEIDQKPVAFPSQDRNTETALMDRVTDAAPEKPLADAPTSTITAERSLENRVVPMTAAKEQADEAKKPETFTARVAANDEQPAQPTPVRA